MSRVIAINHPADERALLVSWSLKSLSRYMVALRGRHDLGFCERHRRRLLLVPLT